MHKAAVRVGWEFKDVHAETCRLSASARRKHRTNQGELKIDRALTQGDTRERFASCRKSELTGRGAVELRGGSDTLQAATKTATLRCFRFLDPI